MNIPKLFRKLPMIADIEIVVALLPKVFAITNQASRYALLQRLDSRGERLPLGFTDE